MAFDIINPNGKANIVLISEHASNHIPSEYDNLGLSDEQLELHIAWDIGIAEVTKNLAKLLDAPAVLAGFSRLLIDANRAIGQDGLIPETSDGHIIHGNQNLSEKATNERIEEFYHPFHNMAAAIIAEKALSHEAPLIFNMHSFTPHMNGEPRKWNGGLLYNTDDRVARLLHDRLEARGFHIGDNEPYSGKILYHTLNTHALAHGLPHVNVEIRQDEISNDAGARRWADVLAEEILDLRSHPELAIRL